ncbi:LOW QUALITY PROTEIN: Polyprotein [Phytophthora palmivora]|uniref:Polyprotein n=1 Tax=Phytophthora palmivora TaxID=4796 RepID=A0A2P4YGC4_9STRA|nr:LOW QUALITY PROTEIN: Polyprotein [Phytophthora palmivora]
MDPDSMTTAAREACDGPSCAACEQTTCTDPELETQDVSDAIEQVLSRSGEQRLPSEVVGVVERGLPRAVEQRFPRVVEGGLSDVVSRRPSANAPDMIEHDLSSSAETEFERPVRRRGRRKPRHPRTLSSDPTESEVRSVLTKSASDTTPCVQDVRVACPPRDAAAIRKLPVLSRKYFLRDLKHGEIDQVCVIAVDDATSTAAVVVNAEAPPSDGRTRPKGTESKSAREARYTAQSLPALEAFGKPVAPLVHEFIDIFPDKVPVVLPPGRGVRHEIDLGPVAKYCVTRQWTLPRDQGRRQAGQVREILSPHSSPTFCEKTATGGWRIVHAFNNLNDATIPAQIPIPRKDIVLDAMSSIQCY